MSETPDYHNALTLGSMLLEYRLISVLGAGGFGITYLAWDSNLEKNVAIKEYLPGELAMRALDGSVVAVNTQSEFNYQWGLDRFIQEARTLAKFSHPNIVRVNRYFESNGTSYMVMDYEDGESLHQYLRRLPMPDEPALKSIIMPILDGLQAIHAAGFLHRDIKPSNVFIRRSGVPVLIDFGSARLAGRGISRSITAVVTPGYAPLEQYSNEGNQGPWSDIYALSAVIYRAVTGENPADAVRRMKSDDAAAALMATRPRYSERFLKAVEWGMTVDEKMRPQNVVEWRDLFLGRAPLTAVSRGPSAFTGQTTPPGAPSAKGATAPRTAKAVVKRQANSAETTRSRWVKWLIVGGVLVVALAGVLALRQHLSVEASSAPSAPPLQRPAADGSQPEQRPAAAGLSAEAAVATQTAQSVR